MTKLQNSINQTTVNSSILTESASPFQTAIGVGAIGSSTGMNNTAVGYNALTANTTGASNTAVGVSALASNTTGIDNVAVGNSALSRNTVGTSNVAIGFGALQTNTANGNTAVGYSALNTNTTGASNTAVGYQALALNSTGIENLAVGYSALANATTAVSNTAIGFQAMGASTVTGINNTAVGHQALRALTGGQSNTAIGLSSMIDLTVGSQNVGLGQGTLQDLVSTSENTAVGFNALHVLLTGSNNTAIGYSAGSSYVSNESSNISINSTGTATENNVLRIGSGTGTGTSQLNSCYIQGIYSQNSSGFSSPKPVLVDTSTGQLGYGPTGAGAIVTIDGDSGSVTGSTVTLETLPGTNGGTATFSGSSSTMTLSFSDGSDNTSLGNSSMVTSGNSHNTAFGYQALKSSVNTNNNVAIGYQALSTIGNDTSASYGVAVGTQSLMALSSGFNTNTAVGYVSLYQLTSGNSNIAIGYPAGTNYTSSESNNILICNPGVASESNVIRIGQQGSGGQQQNVCYIAGISGTTVTGLTTLCSVSGQLGDVSSALKFKENVKDIDETSSLLFGLRPVSFNYKSDPDHRTCYGMIAEEVEKILPELVVQKDGEAYGIKYHEMPVLLLNELQKLRKEVDDLKNRLR